MTAMTAITVITVMTAMPAFVWLGCGLAAPWRQVLRTVALLVWSATAAVAAPKDTKDWAELPFAGRTQWVAPKMQIASEQFSTMQFSSPLSWQQVRQATLQAWSASGDAVIENKSKSTLVLSRFRPNGIVTLLIRLPGADSQAATLAAGTDGLLTLAQSAQTPSGSMRQNESLDYADIASLLPAQTDYRRPISFDDNGTRTLIASLRVARPIDDALRFLIAHWRSVGLTIEQQYRPEAKRESLASTQAIARLSAPQLDLTAHFDGLGGQTMVLLLLRRSARPRH